jgi:hypothetical protein
MTVDRLQEFFLFVDPLKPAEHFDRIWQHFRLETEIALSDGNLEHRTRASFIRFRSDFPSVTNAILALPHLSTFDEVFSRLLRPHFALIGFIQRRFGRLVSVDSGEVSSELHSDIQRPILLFRDALVLCDIATALVYAGEQMKPRVIRLGPCILRD